MIICLRCASDHDHLRISRRPVIAPDAVTKPVHSQTNVCGLRNRGCNSTTLRGYERHCQWVFAVCSIFVKWHVVCGAATKNLGAKVLYRSRHEQTKMTVLVQLQWFTLAGTNVRQTWNKVRDMENKEREYKVILSYMMSSWSETHHSDSKSILQNMKSWNRILKSIPKNMWH